MKPLIIVLIAGFLASCATNPAKVESVATQEAGRLAAPTKPLSSFANFELAPMVYDDRIKAEKGKMEEATEFQNAYKAILQPLLTEWNTGMRESASGTLVIESHLVGLRIISGSARFWAGGYAGDSFIDLDLLLSDKESGERVAKVRVYRDADAITGAWSIGKSDQNLDEYIVSIVETYLRDNF